MSTELKGLLEQFNKNQSATHELIARRDEEIKNLTERVREVENASGRPGAGPPLRDEETGETLHALAPSQSVRASLMERGEIPAPGAERLGVGNVIRAMITGPRTDREIKALHEGSDSAGGFAVRPEYAAPVIDLMRKKSRTIQAGARTVPVESDKAYYLRIASDPAAAWRLERGTVAVSDMTFGRMTFTPRSLAVLLKISRELVEDAPNTAQIIEDALAQSMAVEVDRVGLFGSGIAPEPLGVTNTAGVNVLDLGTNGAAVASYAPILAARRLMLEANGAEPTAAIMAPRTSTAFEGLTDASGQPLQRPRAIEALPFLATTQVPVNEKHGTATDASRIIVGDFSQLWFGVRVGFQLELLREPFASTMEFGILAHMRVDVQVAQPAAFTDIRGIIPA